MNDQNPTEPFADAGIASVENGQVVLDGPDGVAITLTPDAAARTGQSLVAAAQQAREGQERKPAREAG